jgi:hypothetical protein
MSTYMRNRSCPCQRCRIRGLMGAGILITVGFLLLLENYGIVYFDASGPAILIVIGLFLFASHNASMEGHIQPYGLPGSAPPNSSHQNNSQVTS